MKCATCTVMTGISISQACAERSISKAEVARRIGVHRSCLTRWDRSRVPADRVIDVERAIGVPRERIRPDLYAPAPTGSEAA